MEPSEILEALLDLAREAKLEVRPVSAGAGEVGLMPPTSAVCRVRGAVWVMLSSADPVSIQLRVLAEALREHAVGVSEAHFLPPAVRAALED